eukprot:SAG31_NODE_7075_length_1795_cov_2.020047_2_plen_101_part_00
MRADNHKVKGLPLDKSALPNQDFWCELVSLVRDGFAFIKEKIDAFRGNNGGYVEVGDAMGAENNVDTTKPQDGAVLTTEDSAKPVDDDPRSSGSDTSLVE